MATTTTTLLNSESTSSTPSLTFKIFSLISIASALSALSFFPATTDNIYLVSFTYIFSTAFIAFHTIAFSLNRNLRNAKILQGGFIKYIATPAMFFAVFDLYFVPEKTVDGLLFVICIWIDVHALIQIIRPVKQLKYLPNLIFMLIVDRAIHLYGFTITYWIIMFFCFMLMYVMDFYGHKIYESADNGMGETEGVMGY